MRLLIIDVNHEHPNTMHRNFYKSLSEVMSVEYYGPGYTEESVLREGLKVFLSGKKHFDIIMVTWAFVLTCIDFSSPRVIYRWHRYEVSKYKIGTAIRYDYGILKELLKYNGSRKVLVYYHDVVNLSDEWYEKIRSILENDFYLLTCGAEFLPLRNSEKRKVFGQTITNNVLRLDKDFHDKIISIPVQAAMPDEFEYRLLKEREYDWVVPGCINSDYPERKKIFDRISKAGYSIWDEALDRGMAYKYSRITRKDSCVYFSRKEKLINTYLLNASNVYIPNQIKAEELGRFHENYRVGLRKARMAYADGGLGKAIVRKYIEIPAAGTVLMCDDIVGLGKLGFKDGVNAVFVNSQNVVKKTRQICLDADYMQSLADEGRNLIIQKHTVSHRVRDVRRAFKMILEEAYCGGCWENGEFYIDGE